VSKDAKTRVYRNGGSFVDGIYDDDDDERDGIGANLLTTAHSRAAAPRITGTPPGASKDAKTRM
jgi:hypothetical protein